MTDDQMVDKVVEKVLLRIPDIIGNLIKNHANMQKLNYDFYQRYPEFQNHKGVVCSVIEMIESQNFSMQYEQILEKAAPMIQTKLNMIESTNIETLTNNFPKTVDLPDSNGVL